MTLLSAYNALWYAAAPLIKRRLQQRARLNPDYALHQGERFGQPYAHPIRHAIWIHAVSVGETRAAAPLIHALQQHLPQTPLLLTQMTPTGRATAQTLYPHAQSRYLPYDRADWVEQFLREHQPRCGILMETEIWPNLIAACRRHNIPLFLANARLSEQSQRGYQRIRALIAPALQSLAAVYAQTPADAGRLQQLGAANVQISGNTKYDITPPPESATQAQALRQLIGTRPVWIAASTREKNGCDEAELILRAWQQQPNRPADSLLIIVPRHPERFQAAFDSAQQFGFSVQKRSSGQTVRPDTQIWIGDSMGELFAYYQAADFAFVGGSLIDTGCQNIIEPLSCGKAVLFGPSTYNFQAACHNAQQTGAAVQIADAQALAQTATQWLKQPESRQSHARHALSFVQAHQGAAERIAADLIARLQTGNIADRNPVGTVSEA